MDDNTPSEGSETVPIQVGSHIMHIINTAEPQLDNADPGKLDFVWGDQVWDSYSDGTPCNSTQFREGGPWWYACNYRCDK